MMKHRFWLMTFLVVGALALARPASETDQLKADLIGQCMGGREKCWKFQSPDQVKDLVIKSRTEDAERRVYVIGLQLQATATSSRFAADARVEYAKAGTTWKLKHVGLLSLARIR